MTSMPDAEVRLRKNRAYYFKDSFPRSSYLRDEFRASLRDYLKTQPLRLRVLYWFIGVPSRGQLITLRYVEWRRVLTLLMFLVGAAFVLF